MTFTGELMIYFRVQPKLWYLSQALQKVGSVTDGGEEFLTSADIEQLLKDSDDIVDKCPRDTIFGYPTRPLYRELGTMLQLWLDSGWEVYDLSDIFTSIWCCLYILLCFCIFLCRLYFLHNWKSSVACLWPFCACDFERLIWPLYRYPENLLVYTNEVCRSIHLTFRTQTEHRCPLLLLWPWPSPNDLEIWTWVRYSEDVPANQKQSL